MNIHEGTYLMWFSRFGATECHAMPSIEDCYDLALMLEDAETYVFDQYGVLGEVEKVGEGVVPDDEWERGLEEYRAVEVAECQASSEAIPRDAGAIDIRRPGRGWAFSLVSSPSVNDLRSEEARLAALLGRDRVQLRLYKEAQP
ncbi:hypothetical protein [Rhodococcus ruber]|uniref:hypothetical protein n=1 Tax=Rhodococcus ruber TaxID=1830 RepID=UPI003D817DAA